MQASNPSTHDFPSSKPNDASSKSKNLDKEDDTHAAATKLLEEEKASLQKRNLQIVQDYEAARVCGRNLPSATHIERFRPHTTYVGQK